MNNIVLNVYRPKIRNGVWAIFYGITVAVCVTVLFFDISTVPTTVSEKITNCTVFSLFLCTGVLMFGAMINCIRNIFSEPVLILDNDGLSVFRKETVKLCDIKTVDVSRKKDKIVFIMKNGETVAVKQSSLSIPVDTVAYAVNIRLNQK